MNEYLTEKEQLELFREWWRDYGWYLVGGAAVAVLGYFGWNQYQAREQSIAEQAASLYIELQQAVEDDSPEAERILAELHAEHPDSPYAYQGSLLIARDVLISDPARATEELRHVMTTSSDTELAMVARLRLARVLAWRESFDDALALLQVAEPGRFAARISEIEGDIHVARGDATAARAAYERALADPGWETLDRNLLSIKLNDLEPVQTVSTAGEEGE